MHPKVAVNTKYAREILPDKINLSSAIKQWGNISGLTAGFINNDIELIKDSMHDTIIEPIRSKLIPGFPEVKEAALNAGADGMIISGSGPTVFAISNSMKKASNIAYAMKKAFNTHNIKCKTLITSPSIDGAKVLES